MFNPNNLPDMLKSHLNYPALGLNEFANEFAEYTRSEKRDIGSPEELVSWWCAHPPSLFRGLGKLIVITSYYNFIVVGNGCQKPAKTKVPWEVTIGVSI